MKLCCGAAGAVLLMLLTARPAEASIITFSDNTFNPSDWSLTTQTKEAGGDAADSLPRQYNPFP